MQSFQNYEKLKGPQILHGSHIRQASMKSVFSRCQNRNELWKHFWILT